MDFSTIDLDALIPKLEDRRVSLNLSYQNVADACNVSQSTIIRIFKRQADPSIVVLRSILAAVKYDIVTPPMPDEGSENEQIEYLKKSIEFEREDKIVRLAQQEAQFMRQHNEDRRLVRICLIICIILVIFVCFLFGYDIANLDRGVALHPEGVDRNIAGAAIGSRRSSRPPPGGRG